MSDEREMTEAELEVLMDEQEKALFDEADKIGKAGK